MAVSVSLLVTSATGLGLQLMVTMYPVMCNLGISPASACGVIATSQAFEIGPTQINAIFFASQIGMESASYLVAYQIWLVVTMLLPMQLASCIGRAISPIAAVLIVCAGTARVSPFVVAKCTRVPMAGLW